MNSFIICECQVVDLSYLSVRPLEDSTPERAPALLDLHKVLLLLREVVMTVLNHDGDVLFVWSLANLVVLNNLSYKFDLSLESLLRLGALPSLCRIVYFVSQKNAGSDSTANKCHSIDGD